MITGVRLSRAGSALVAALAAASTVAARAEGAPPSARDVVSKFLACEALALPAERLACFDAALKDAKRRLGLGEETAAKPRPRTSVREDMAAGAPQTGGAAGSPAAAQDDQTRKRFEATIVAAATDAVGRWIFTLDNGEVWQASGGTWLKHTDYVGRTVVAKRGWMGGWRFKIREYGEVGRFRRLR